MMLVSTPSKHYLSHRNNSYDMNMSPPYQRRCTPPRLCSDSMPYDSPMLTPSPLRQRPLFPNNYLKDDAQDADDLFLQSPFKSPVQAQHLPSSQVNKPQPIPIDDEEGSIFRASTSTSFSPFFPASGSQPLLTPLKQVHRVSSRPALSARNLNGLSALSASPALTASTRVGVGTKRKSTPHVTPLRQHNLTPLKLAPFTPADDSGSGTIPFDRLAPLPALQFTDRTPSSKAETEAHLTRQTATLTRLRITDRNGSDNELSGYADDSGCEMEDADDGNILFLSKVKPQRKPGSFGRAAGRVLVNKGKEKEEVAEAISPGGHVIKRRARSRPVSVELLEQSMRIPSSPSRSKHITASNRPRLSGSVAFPSVPMNRSKASPISSPSETGSPLPRRRTSATASHILRRPSSNTQLSHFLPQRAPLSRIESGTLFFGPAIPIMDNTSSARSRTNTNLTSAIPPPTARLQTARPKAVNRHSYSGTGSGTGNLQAWNTIQTRPTSPSPESSPLSLPQENVPLQSPNHEEEDMFFGVGPQESSFVFSVTEGTPSPTSKKELPVKYRPRDSGVVFDDDEMFSASSDFLSVMPRASTSVSSICSDDGLITPGAGPETNSGWPSATVIVKGTDEGDRSILTAREGGVNIDAFIMRTLAAASKGPGDVKKKVPGTPVKKVRTTFLGSDRPWQSAVATKVGLRDDCAFKKAPRKSLPAAFPSFGRKLEKGASDSTDTEDEDESPSGKKDKYVGLGLGRPPPSGKDGLSAIPRSHWLMRRSSSGAFSSGSESASQANTPTRVKGIDWQLPKPRIPVHFSPSSNALRLSPGRSTSGSSSSSAPTLDSPTNGSRRLPISGTSRPQPPLRSVIVARRLSEPFGEEQPGRYERDFAEVYEVGSGEFGRVVKVRCKNGNIEEVFAIKKSKRFEGAKHRLRLREEVDILKHLSQAAITGGLEGRHPNVLAYIDSWEEDEALYIRTELCESGNLARFLWEYGRVFPRLDEARVWKIVVDLSNGLRFIHDAGVIHLDIKPSNVFVTKEGRFKIGDFGMASLWPRPRPADARPGEGGGFEREGDKLYLAPEVLQGRYGKAADVFSFGMTILETASNIVVPDQGEAWHRLRQEDFSQVDMDCSPELATMIRQMMRSNPTLRMSAQEIWEHPVICRTRRAMERMYIAAKTGGGGMFSASPLAGVPDGFLEEILGQDDMYYFM